MKKIESYNERQESLLEYLRIHGERGIADLAEFIAGRFSGKNTRVTVGRDIALLVEEGMLVKKGKGRATVYSLKADLDEYFSVDQDKRKLRSEYFNFAIWEELGDLFRADEIAELDRLNRQYRKNRAALSPILIQKELERLTIEFSWKSSKIEGNTYTLLDTERLIREQIEAKGKKHEEAVMILNHKKALDFVFKDAAYFRTVNITKMEELHRLLTGGLEVQSGIRRNRVGITGTNYRPLDNEHQIRESLERLAVFINNLPAPVAKAMATVLMISYIQPFEDGNKRTARLLGNALLLAHDYCALSYRSVDEDEYRKGVLLFYEQQDFSRFKRLFMEQFRQAATGYF